MDITDKIKQFINDSISSLFVKQKEDFSLIVHKETLFVVSELKTFISQQFQVNERDMANMQQNVFSLNKELQNLLVKLDVIQEGIEQLKEHQVKFTVDETDGFSSLLKSPTMVYYAQMVDSTSPLGFKTVNLKKSAEGCAFKITLNDGVNGVYEMVDDEEIQQEMLAAFNPIISESSVFDVIPCNPTRIVVVEKGEIVKENEVFKIISKQKIKIE